MLRPGHGVALCALALLTLGVLMVNSASMQVDAPSPMSIASLAQSRPAAYAVIAVLAMAACSFIPLRRFVPANLLTPQDEATNQEPAQMEHRFFSGAWFSQLISSYLRLWPLWLMVLGLVVVLASVYMPGIARPMKGSHRWISLRLPGLESIQPSEIAKWALVALLAWYGARFTRRMPSFWLGLVPGLAAAGLVAGFIVLEDLGTGALLAAVSAVVLLAAGGRMWQLLLLTPVPVAGAVLAIVTNPYRMHRIESFMNPYLDPQGKGFHMIQSMVSIASGNKFGNGLGHSLQKYGYLPEDTTDFLFAIICDELGLAGAGLVVTLFSILLWSLWLIIRRERIVALKLFALGVLATIGIQALINIAVVTGIAPTKGIALPLLSSGGTGWILTGAALGMVIAIDRAQARQGARLLHGLGELVLPVRTHEAHAAHTPTVAATVATMLVAAPALAVAPATPTVQNTADFGASSELPPPLPPALPPVLPGNEPAVQHTTGTLVEPATDRAPDGYLFPVKPTDVVITQAGKGWPATGSKA